MPFDPLILEKKSKSDRYKHQIDRISKTISHVANITEAIEDSIKNIESGCRSFVIYGEPQSGKTEMMIALTARLLDFGKKIIIILLNDNIQLLNQNLDRFKRSNIDFTPKLYSDIINQTINIQNSERIIFSKKNSRDLQKLITIIDDFHEKIIIDD
ncbi:DEAD/DEAH box helicase family protein [Legionella saoudiensis]|uniref:DEAD/DEAH box helicase family protein n=1 Tax=Legionella saoudiensis TaxID=1750561 RepID=UPI000731AFBB|nr:DEAD/DEAH box helicase family protein [Legionella saoudiensis]